MPRTAKEMNKQSFSVAALVIWSSLLKHLRSSSISEVQFQCGLETHVFLWAYNLSQPSAEERIELNGTELVEWYFVRVSIVVCCSILTQHYTNDARLQVEHSNMLSRG